MTNYCTEAQVRDRIGTQIAAQAAQIQSAIATASAWVDQHCGRTFDQDAAATARVFSTLNPCLVRVDDFHSTADLVVAVDQTGSGAFTVMWTAGDDFQLEPLNQRQAGATWPYTRIRALRHRRFYPSPEATIQVTAQWGWPAIPDAVEQATIIRATALFLRKQSPTGVQDGFGEFGAVRVSRFTDPDVSDLLAPYRLAGSAVMIA